MADVYTCKYAFRYASEIVYALRRFKDLINKEHMNVISFGCGPCTDLFALDYLKRNGEMHFKTIEYRGIDYSKNVWCHIHDDIKTFEADEYKITFSYENICQSIHKLFHDTWDPDLIVFQYVLSDMHKHTGTIETESFINTFSEYYNKKVLPNTYTILNDINLGNDYGGGREYFDLLCDKIESSTVKKGRFRNDNSKSSYYPYGYTYGETSDGEFSDNRILFNSNMWQKYSPFKSCASAQMLIKKEAGI